MSAESSHSNSVEFANCLARLKNGDKSARDEVLAIAGARLTRLARKMLRDFPGVRRWEQTDDVFQNAVLRLCRSLEHVVPDSTAGLMRLAARDIRCALIDLARHYGGPEGRGAHHASASSISRLAEAGGPLSDTHEPTSLAYWTEFHQSVQQLPDEQQQVFDLIWYQGLTQEEAGSLLEINERTVQRRWRQACLSLHETLGGPPPGID